MKSRWKTLIPAAAVGAALALGAGAALAAHPAVQLFTYEEAAAQFDPLLQAQGMPSGSPLPVMVDGGGRGFPYSPKATCGQCHDYDSIEGHSFHSQLGGDEWLEVGNSQSGKQWTQSTAMFGKW